MSSASGGHFVTCPPLCSVVLPAPAPSEPATPTDTPPKPVTGVVRVCYAGAGLLSVGMAYLGVLLPGLPATPWVLLASYLFSKSSPRLEGWLRRSPLFGPMLRDWMDHHGIRRPIKVLAVCLIVIVVSISIALGGLPVWVKCMIGGLAAVGICTIVFAVPTVSAEAPRR